LPFSREERQPDHGHDQNHQNNDSLNRQGGARIIPRGSFFVGFLGVGKGGIYAVRERANVVAQRALDTIDRDRDGRQDERVFGHRLATDAANHGLTSTDKQLRH
jgi:hypothetical protein